MSPKDRDIQCKLKILKHAEETGHVGRACRYFGMGRASFYRWKAAFEEHGEACRLISGTKGWEIPPATSSHGTPMEQRHERQNHPGLRYSHYPPTQR